MKLMELFTAEKKFNVDKFTVQFDIQFKEKHGYYWKFSSHSSDYTVLANNFEKDCVIAYIKNKYLTCALIKAGGKDNYKGILKVENIINRNLNGAYSIQIINNKDALELLNTDNIKIINQEEFGRFKKIVLIESI